MIRQLDVPIYDTNVLFLLEPTGEEFAKFLDNEKNKQKIGDENNGYLIVPDTWAEAAISTKVQYANYQDGTVTAVLSMDNVSTLENSAEDWATTIYNTEKNDSKTKTVDASTTKIGNYTAYKVEKERNDGYKQIGWFFETEDGKTHCIIIGGNTLTEDTLSIVDTYTLK